MAVTAYLGPEGTFAEQAAHVLAPGTEFRSAVSVHAAVAALRARQVNAACVPVENSVEGSVPATLDALVEGDPVLAVAETVLPIRFSVLVRPGTGAADVRTVATHPHAAAQVRCWLGTHLPAATTMLTDSTSGAAVAVLEGRADAAVCAPVALAHYPLAELAGGVHDKDDAQTRFLLLRRPGTLPPPTGTDRTSLVAIAADRPGALPDRAAHAMRSTGLTTSPVSVSAAARLISSRR